MHSEIFRINIYFLNDSQREKEWESKRAGMWIRGKSEYEVQSVLFSQFFWKIEVVLKLKVTFISVVLEELGVAERS